MLNKNQEEFVVERINKYTTEVNEIKKSISLRIFRIGIGTIGAVLMATKAQGWNIPDLVSVPILAGSIYFAVYNAGHLISNIAGKVGLAIRMNELYDQAQLMDSASQEEEKDKGRGK
jgi:hypothetical protein